MKMKKFTALVLVFCTMLSLTACSADFDAKGYTQSFLDVIAKKEYKQYAEITDTTEESAQSQRQQLVDTSVTSILSGVTVSDDTKKEIEAMFDTVYSKWNYVVEDAVKNDDGSFTVPVQIKKLCAFSGAFDTCVERVKERIKEIDTDDLQSYYSVFYSAFAEAVTENVSKGTYEDAVTISVKVQLAEGKDNTYTISQDSVSEIYDAVTDLDKLQTEASAYTDNE